ncbi:LRRC45 [Symbiodinium necroappetens]|uniref:LRRC45 protein n=1 Tax=Symbiodinium necroappetens TaxID=1628268 RepID=A0A813ALW6_9DINO|nr:LRRC45 [Symbiodinium necroappetens]
MLAPLLSRHIGVVPFLTWEQRLLEPNLRWPVPASRVEDGAGSCSTGSWSVPQGEDCFKQLRQAWIQRITCPAFLGKFRANLASGSKDPPLSDVELRPFLDDLRCFLRLSDKEFETLKCVPPGQPFRLFLLEALLEVSRDPDLAFIDILVEGVPLGVDEAMPSCPALFPPSEPVAPSLPLQHCESAWGSALSDPETVDSLLESEIREGWVQPVFGGLASLKAQYSRSAVGKLGLVKAPDRDPRLVVDSSVSGVTDHTSLPNKSANPTISGLRRCSPARPALEKLFALILDVSKAHRRILIRPSDRGLLCFFHREVLYQCLTLNFGARASGFYWARLAGLLSRLLHRLIYVRHALLIYVDDLISLLSGPSAPVWAALMCIFLLILRVPMSWHKAYLGCRPTWIGWCISLTSFTAAMEPSKQDQSLPPLVHVALGPDKWSAFRSNLSNDLVLSREIGIASCPKGCSLISVAQKEAFADACADSRQAGLGGFVRLPNSRTVWFRACFSAAELQHIFPWFPPHTSPQKFIAAWELLGQIALLWCVALLIPAAHHPIHFSSRCDNSPSDSAAWKGISMARGMCSLLLSYFLWQRHFCVSTCIEHVPGFRNVTADGLSRSKDPSQFGLRVTDEVTIPWQLISVPPRGTYLPESEFSASKFPAFQPSPQLP